MSKQITLSSIFVFGAFSLLNPKMAPPLGPAKPPLLADCTCDNLNVSGSVGIGITPVVPLHVNGQFLASSACTVGGVTGWRGFYAIGSSGGVTKIGATSATVGRGDLAIQVGDTDCFYLRANDGYVGIGPSFTNPATPLDVRGQFLASSSYTTGGQTGWRGFYALGASAGGVTQIGATSGTVGRGDLSIQAGDSDCIYVKANNGFVGIGNTSPDTRLHVTGTVKATAVTIVGGSDLAEPFQVIDGENAAPGMVLSIDTNQEGKLRLAKRAFDTSVVGVVSGAGGVNPGLTLRQESSAVEGSHPIALTGRVYCWCDASYGVIRPGDLLTTSETAGHAMKVGDSSKAFGSILGKALTPLKEGKGLVLIVVSLQ